jgi:hypothetical protein
MQLRADGVLDPSDDVAEGRTVLMWVGPAIVGSATMADGAVYDVTPPWVPCRPEHRDELDARITELAAR